MSQLEIFLQTCFGTKSKLYPSLRYVKVLITDKKLRLLREIGCSLPKDLHPISTARLTGKIIQKGMLRHGGRAPTVSAIFFTKSCIETSPLSAML